MRWLLILVTIYGSQASVRVKTQIRNSNFLNTTVFYNQLVNVSAVVESNEAGLWISSDVCPPGTWSQPNATQCFLCAEGYASNKTGATSCPICDAGSWSSVGATSCIQCAKDTWTDTEGSAACLPCPPHSQTDGLGASDILQCKCVLSYFRTSNLLAPMITSILLTAPNIFTNVPHVTC